MNLLDSENRVVKKTHMVEIIKELLRMIQLLAPGLPEQEKDRVRTMLSELEVWSWK